MADDRKKTPGPAAGARPGRELQAVNDRLKELVASLKTSRERRSVDARPPGAAPPAPETSTAPAAALGGGEAVDLEKRRLAAELALAREAVAHATAERDRLRERVAELERESRRVSDDFVTEQERTTALAQLYVALERIHGSVDRRETLAAVQDVVINVVGSEELAVFERRGDALLLAQSFGIDPEPLRTLRIGEGAVGRAAATGRLYVAGREEAPSPGEEDLTAAIPLRAGADVVGVVAIYRLLGHKPGLGETDQAVFDLLAAHAGLALHLRGGAAP